MGNLLWPGDERADTLMTDTSVLAAMVRVESAWLGALVAERIAPADIDIDLSTLISTDDVVSVTAGAENGGSPAIGLVTLLRSRAPEPAATWLHRGLTSQDVVDTALMLSLSDVLDRLTAELQSQVVAASILVKRHASTVMVGRTLTQHAAPTTFGAVAAGWLDGLIDAAEQVTHVRTVLPAQFGGAVGNLAALTELARLRGRPDPTATAMRVAEAAATELSLRATRPWHTHRGPMTRVGDTMVSCTDAWGHVATDVTTLSRTEIAELGEPAANGRGGSSTMPHKRNPVLSLLVRRAALSMPALGSTLHLAAATAGDQRSDGGWHAEWATLATMGRRAVVAASQTTEVLQGLRVDADRMRATLGAASEEVLAERQTMAALFGSTPDAGPTRYIGASEDIARTALVRAHTHLEDKP